MSGRIVFDISTLARWSGPSVGIVRVERELALWARKHKSGVVFVMFDPLSQNYRPIQGRWLDAILEGSAFVQTWGLPDPRRRRKRGIDRVPGLLRTPAMWVLQLRRQLIMLLERQRISAKRAWIARVAETAQNTLMTERYRWQMMRADGTRRSIIPYEWALGEVLELGRGDLLVNAGSAWSHSNVAAVAAQKLRTGFRYVIFCYDIIPLLFPNYYLPHDVEQFRTHYHVAFPAADVVVFSARKIEADAHAYCAGHGLAIAESRIIPLGADAVALAREARAPLPSGIEAGRYALYVSTIEPRKGHRLLYEVWLRLLADGVPQECRFKLVFVGRLGWLIGDLIEKLERDPRLQGTIVVLPGVDDRQLAGLYAGAAFCLYPSAYEGYGLPIIEAFFHGKAVLASTGGAIPEVVGEFSPCLDPRDTDLWYSTLKRWIVDPNARAPYEEAIRCSFRHPTWDEAAARFFREVERPADDRHADKL